MPEYDIQATFNGQLNLDFVQGEDRAIAVSLRDGNTGNPIDLSGAHVAFGFVGNGGQPVRRFSGPLHIGPHDVGPNAPFTSPDHGLVTGDAVTLSGGDGIPAPLQPQTTYIVQVSDANTFVLADGSGDPIAVTSAPTGSFYLSMTDVVVNTPTTSGLITLLLREAVTASIQPGMAQTFQIEVVTSDGLKRIVLERNELDVYSQVVQ